MAIVYLIGVENDDTVYKIGVTKSSNAEGRLKQLQTANSEPLYLKETYHTDTPFKLEKMLHNHYNRNKTHGEWFNLNEEEVKGFKNVCELLQGRIDILSNNPFFNKRKEIKYQD